CCYNFFFSSRRRHTRCYRDWSSDVCSSDLWSYVCPKLAGLRNVGLETHVTPGGAFEDAAELGAVVRLVLVDPERHASQRVDRPEIGRASCRERVWSWEDWVAVEKELYKNMM